MACACRRISAGLREGLPETSESEPSDDAKTAVSSARAAFQAAMDDDFGTPGGLAAIDGLISAGKDFLIRGDAGVAAADRRLVADAIVSLCRVLGLRAERLGAGPQADDASGDLLGLIGELRTKARGAKDWATADRIRDRLADLGWEIRDRQDGGTDIVKN